MKKKANGEGSIYQRGNGRWVGCVTLGQKNGKQHRKEVYGKTKTDVAKKLRELQVLLDKGSCVPVGKATTLGHFLTDWLENTAKPRIRYSTYAGYEVQVRLHILPNLGKIKLSRLGALDLQRHYRAEADRGCGPRTIQMQHKLLKRALGEATKWGLVAQNVANLVDTPRVPRKSIQHLSIEGAKNFLTSIRGTRLEQLYVLTLATGLRRGEVLGLRWSDVDLTRGILSVNHTLAKVRGGWQLQEPKTASSRRVVRMPDFVVAGLNTHRVRQLEEKARFGLPWNEEQFVFVNEAGQPIDGNNLHHSYKAHLRDAGLAPLSFHALRHSAATLMLSLGVQPKVVAEMLGHANIKVTLDVYSHVLPHLQEDAASKMNALLGPGSTFAAVT